MGARSAHTHTRRRVAGVRSHGIQSMIQSGGSGKGTIASRTDRGRGLGSKTVGVAPSTRELAAF